MEVVMKMDEYKEWLESLKVGDLIAYDARRRHTITSHYIIKKVERITKTLIISGDNRWRIKDGDMVGSDSWRDRLVPVTDDIIQSIERKKIERSFSIFTEDKNIDKYTNEQLEAVISILSGDAA